jgi:indole-3-glycerol phosphate synthase
VAGIAVLADENVGGCTYADIASIVTEQSRAHTQVPGPVIVINSDIIIDELQVAQSKVLVVGAVVVSLPMNGLEQTQKLLQCSQAVELECIVSVETKEQAQEAIDLGANMIMVTNVDGADAKQDVICDLAIPENRRVTTIANIRAYNDNQWLEVEEAWAIRDKGFNCVWVGDALYKSGTDVMETPAAIIKAMKSKSSVKWASPKVYTGKGEGAREYLGDIMM